MTKITITIGELIQLDLLKDVINKLQLEVNNPKNINLIMIKDYVNDCLPEKYKHFRPDENIQVEINIDSITTKLALKNWIN